MGDEGVVRGAGRAGTAPQTLLPCLGVTHMWENLKRASKLMLRSKTFMVPGWDGPTAAPQGCKLQGEGGSGRNWSPPKPPPGAEGEPRSCRASGRSYRGSGAFLSSWCKHCQLLHGQRGPGVLQGCCKARAALRDVTVGLL